MNLPPKTEARTLSVLLYHSIPSHHLASWAKVNLTLNLKFTNSLLSFLYSYIASIYILQNYVLTYFKLKQIVFCYMHVIFGICMLVDMFPSYIYIYIENKCSQVLLCLSICEYSTLIMQTLFPNAVTFIAIYKATKYVEEIL